MKFLCDKIGDGLFSGDQFVQMRRREVKRKAGIRQYQLQLSVCVVVDRQVDAVVKRLAERITESMRTSCTCMVLDETEW